MVGMRDAHEADAGFARLFDGNFHGVPRNDLAYAVLRIQQRRSGSLSDDFGLSLGIDEAAANAIHINARARHAMGRDTSQIRLHHGVRYQMGLVRIYADFHKHVLTEADQRIGGIPIQ
jgi:hypothetical protein